MTCDERREAIFELLAGALAGAERAELEAHLASGCEACDAECARAREWITTWALEAGATDPPDAARARLLAHAAAEATPRRGPPRSAARWLLAAGLAGVAAALGAVAVETWRAAPLRAERDALAARAEALAREGATLEANRLELEETLVEQDEELNALDTALADARDALATLRAPDVAWLALAAAGPEPNGDGPTARVYWAWEDYTCYVHAESMPPLADGHRYALWLDLEDGSVFPVGVLDAEPSGEGSLFARLPRDFPHVVGARISEEPGDLLGTTPKGPIRLSSAGSAL